MQQSTESDADFMGASNVVGGGKDMRSKFRDLAHICIHAQAIGPGTRAAAERGAHDELLPHFS